MKVLKVILVLVFLGMGFGSTAQEVKAVKVTDLEKIIAESKTPLIINMWATWCKPCIEELPYFLSEVKAHQQDSVQLLLVSLDFKESFPAGISAFVKKRKYNAPVVWLDETDADYFCPKIDPKWSGAIPASLFINNKTGYRKFVEEQLTHEELKAQIKSLLSGE
ncbi:MAG: redoxin domain-containing protein [Chitinophagaceae bacterium]|nr:redoxin domain-containing protein [Chitinophagaceae bacterium]